MASDGLPFQSAVLGAEIPPVNYWELPILLGGMSGKDSATGRGGGRHALMAICDLKTVTCSVK